MLVGLMFGPQPKGHWSGSNAGNAGKAYQFLTQGGRYRVIQRFVDFDRHEHPVGETWIFRGHSFLPHDDGLALIVSLDGEQEWMIRMQLREEEQGPIDDALDEFIAPCEPAG